MGGPWEGEVELACVAVSSAEDHLLQFLMAVFLFLVESAIPPLLKITIEQFKPVLEDRLIDVLDSLVEAYILLVARLLVEDGALGLEKVRIARLEVEVEPLVE